MKKYFNDQAGCAHAWAHGHYREGHASNFFFDGPVIYSYGRHFPIAYLNGHTVFFTLKKRSVSTTGHKNIVLSAISHKNIVFVDEVPTLPEQINSVGWIRSNVDYWTNKIRTALKELESFPRRKSLMREIERNQSLLLNFLQALHIEITDSLNALLDKPTISSVDAFIIAFDLKKNTELLRKHKQEVKEWRRGARREVLTNDLPRTYANQAYLRINKVSRHIETSKGIKVPLEMAKRFWQFIQLQLPQGCDTCKYSILDYKVDYINAKEIKVGCHTISMKEIHAIVKRMKW